MKRTLQSIFLLLWAIPAWAQSTSVTLQVTDASVTNWSNGSYTVKLVQQPGFPGPPFYLQGTVTPVPNQLQSGALNASGGASLTLTPNASVAPTGTNWSFTVCTSVAGLNCFTQGVTIAGATQTVTLTPPTPLFAIGVYSGTGVPPSAWACTSLSLYVDMGTGNFYDCLSAVWHQPAGGSGTSPFSSAVPGGTGTAGNGSLGSFVWTFSLSSGTNPVITFGNNLVSMNSNFTSAGTVTGNIGSFNSIGAQFWDAACGSYSVGNLNQVRFTCDGTNWPVASFSTNAFMKMAPGAGVNSQTASYTPIITDCGKTIAMNGSSLTLTLPSPPINSACAFDVENLAATSLTISRNSLNIDGVASNLILSQNQGTRIMTDGTNYFTQRGIGVGTGSPATTCTFTSGGGTSPSCAVTTGSNSSAGTIILTSGSGSPAANGTFTLTFAVNFGVNQPSCVWTLSDAAAGQWNARATVIDKTPAIGSDLVNWDNNVTNLSTSTAYQVNYSCGAH